MVQVTLGDVTSSKKPIGKYVKNIIWGHVIYNPIEKPKFKLPYGMATLDEFITELAKEGLYQKRHDHPVSIEVYVVFYTKKILNNDEIEAMKNILIDTTMAVYPFSYELLNEMMEWGYDYSYSDKKEKLQAELRVSRDGENWYEYDISDDVIDELNARWGA